MKLWIGGEVDREVAEDFRVVRSEVESAINTMIAAIDAGEINEWDVIAIIRNDLVFEERVRYSKKNGMDLRLKIPFQEFNGAKKSIQRDLVMEMLFRSLEILKTKYPKNGAIESVQTLVAGVKGGT